MSIFQVADINEPFVPLPLSKLAYNINNSRNLIDFQIEKLNSWYNGT